MKKEVLALIVLTIFIFSCQPVEETQELTRLPTQPVKCAPKTCTSLGVQCGGPYPDGCGRSLNCGTCPAGQTCSNNGQCLLQCDTNTPCPQGLTCHIGQCLPYAQCATDVDCGLPIPLGQPYCSGANIRQRIVAFSCSTPGPILTGGIPGAVCQNTTYDLLVHTCPANNLCQNGKCFKFCHSDADCSFFEEKFGGYVDYPCTNNLCGRDSTSYNYCYDSDNTIPSLLQPNDPSLFTPSVLLQLTPQGPNYLADFCDTTTPGLLSYEWYCDNGRTGAYEETFCAPAPVCYSRQVSGNQYQPFSMNAGYCG